MGSAGDILMAALLELHPEPDRFIERMNGLGIPGVTVRKEPSVKYGITGAHIAVHIGSEEEESRDITAEHTHEHHPGQVHVHTHHHTGLSDIHTILNALPISVKVRNDALAIY